MAMNSGPPHCGGSGSGSSSSHDGRTTDLIEAIQAHKSAGNRLFGPSEANGVVDHFNALSEREKQDLLNFLRSR